MNWIILILAGLMEVGFTFCLGKTKSATGSELIYWWSGFLVALALSMYLMAKAAEKLPIGTVYPVWTGIGAVGAVLVGIFFFHEPASFWRIFFIVILILSIVYPLDRGTESHRIAKQAGRYPPACILFLICLSAIRLRPDPSLRWPPS